MRIERGNRMSYCRKASEAWCFIEQEMEEPTYDYDEELEAMCTEALVLCARNNDVYDVFKSEEAASSFVSVMIMLGFIRPEFLDGSAPELRFVWNYLAEQEILTEEDEEVFMPYYFSNEDYERYMFCFERVEGILKVLSQILDEDELYELRADMMFMGEYDCDEKKLASVKRKICEKKEVILPKLETVFAMY